MNSKVDQYLREGCGRCSFGGTPQCKVNTWRDELTELRAILLASGLVEEVKWSIPCYTFDNKNIVLLSAFKEYCALNFFKGVLLKDEKRILIKPGENSQTARQIRVVAVNDIKRLKSTIASYIKEAIEIEKSGLKVTLKSTPEPIPDELAACFNKNPALKESFYDLTPGRQRAYILYFSSAKQSKTRINRIEKYLQHIVNGKGINDR